MVWCGVVWKEGKGEERVGGGVGEERGEEGEGEERGEEECGEKIVVL